MWETRCHRPTFWDVLGSFSHKPCMPWGFAGSAAVASYGILWHWVNTTIKGSHPPKNPPHWCGVTCPYTSRVVDACTTDWFDGHDSALWQKQHKKKTWDVSRAKIFHMSLSKSNPESTVVSSFSLGTSFAWCMLESPSPVEAHVYRCSHLQMIFS